MMDYRGGAPLQSTCVQFCHRSYMLWLSYRLFLGTRHEDVWVSGGIAPPFLKSAVDGREWSVVADSSPDEVIEYFFNLPNPSSNNTP
jgi:hypothetical protein